MASGEWDARNQDLQEHAQDLLHCCLSKGRVAEKNTKAFWEPGNNTFEQRWIGLVQQMSEPLSPLTFGHHFWLLIRSNEEI